MKRSHRSLVAESFRVARATRNLTLVVAVLAVAVPAGVLGTVGLSIETQAAVLRRLDEVGARTVTVVSLSGGPAIPAAAVDRVSRLSGVEWVVGLGPVFDVRARAPVGAPTPVRAYRATRAPLAFDRLGAGSGGAFISSISSRRVGLGGAYGILDPGALRVVGWFAPGAPLQALDPFILVPTTDDSLLLERLIIQVTDVAWVDPVAAGISAVIGADPNAGTTIQRSSELLAAREAVRGEVIRRDRLLLVAVLLATSAISAFVVFAGTLAGRRDFGRRRALGATRGQLVELVMLGTLWPSLLGALIGVVVGWSYLGSRIGSLPDPTFPLSVGVLAVLAICFASAVPAVIASTRDPLQVIRVP
jgi:putative ABC transport system permease protein